MSFSAIITLTGTVGTDAGPFDLRSNVDSYTTPFESSISKASLVSGYTSSVVPNLTSTVRVQSVGTCTNYIDIGVDDPTVTVYLKCGSSPEEYYYINTSTLNTAFATDSGGILCYQRQESGLLTAMQAIYSPLTDLPSLVSSSCACV